MANTDSRYGLRPVRYISGAPHCGETNEYDIDGSSNSTKIYWGDPVKPTAGGYIVQAAGGDTNIVGVFQGCEYTDEDGKRVWNKYWPGNTNLSNVKAFVADHPDLVFNVQADDNTTPTQATLNANADFAIGTGSSNTGRSGAYLDTSSIVTGAANLRIMRLVPMEENEMGDFADFEVLINEHAYKTTSGT